MQMRQNQQTFTRNLNSYSLAAAALASFVAVDGEASVVSYDNGGFGWSSVNTSNSLLSLNMAGEVRTDGTQPSEMQFEFDHITGTKPPGNKLVVNVGPGSGTNSSGPMVNPARLGGGMIIGANANMPAMQPFGAPITGTFNNTQIGTWNPGDRGFLALAFKNAGQTNFGWADITVHALDSITLNAFAYETENGADIITPVPEPAISTLLMAGGAAGLVTLRRRRQQTAAKA